MPLIMRRIVRVDDLEDNFNAFRPGYNFEKMDIAKLLLLKNGLQ